jgi:septal ring factor EnvC (AmiA/AmiB activator)
VERENNYKLDMKFLIQERDYLEKLYDLGKTKLKASEDQVANLREELIEVKKERKKSGVTVKSIQEELEQSKQENNNLKENIINSTKNLKDQNCIVEKLVKEKEALENQIEKSAKDLATKKKLEIAEVTTYSCAFCTHKVKTEIELQNHVKKNHYIDKWSQSYESHFKKKKKLDVPVQTDDLENTCVFIVKEELNLQMI